MQDKKKASSLPWGNKCMICFKPLGNITNNFIIIPTPAGVLAVIKASEVRKDDVYDRLWDKQEEILTLKCKVFFHKSCRASYTSKSNIKRKQPSTEHEDIYYTDSQESKRIRRCDTMSFDIRSHCFICGKKVTPRSKLTQILTGTGDSTRNKVLSAAEQRNDQ